MIVRLESTKDIEAISRLTTEAFKSMPYSDGSEPQIIRDLRNEGNLTLSLVAVDQNTIVGHIAYSPVTIDAVSDNWFGLGPISVLPTQQKTGIGTLMIKESFRLLKARGAKGVVLIGDPNYYGKFGFVADGKISYHDIPAHLVQWLSFKNDVPSGELTYCRAFPT